MHHPHPSIIYQDMDMIAQYTFDIIVSELVYKDHLAYDVPLEITVDYTPGSPGRMYMPNGDPGYPPESPEMEIFRVLIKKKTVFESQDVSGGQIVLLPGASILNDLSDEEYEYLDYLCFNKAQGYHEAAIEDALISKWEDIEAERQEWGKK